MKDKASETKNKNMKIVVIGGTGLIGSKVVNILRQRGHEVVAASPSSGVNTLTGEGLAETLTGARWSLMWRTHLPSKTSLLSNSSKRQVAIFFSEKSAGVKHHVALSVVGTDRLTGSGRRFLEWLLPREDGPET